MQELLDGAKAIGLYLAPAAVIVLSARKLIRIPDELFRKILHFILLGAYIPFLFAFDTWWISAAFAVSLIIVLFPVLSLASRIPMFSSFVNERKKGEFRSSMVLAVGMIALSITIGWEMLSPLSSANLSASIKSIGSLLTTTRAWKVVLQCLYHQLFLFSQL